MRSRRGGVGRGCSRGSRRSSRSWCIVLLEKKPRAAVRRPRRRTWLTVLEARRGAARGGRARSHGASASSRGDRCAAMRVPRETDSSTVATRSWRRLRDALRARANDGDGPGRWCSRARRGSARARLVDEFVARAGAGRRGPARSSWAPTRPPAPQRQPVRGPRRFASSFGDDGSARVPAPTCAEARRRRSMLCCAVTCAAARQRRALSTRASLRDVLRARDRAVTRGGAHDDHPHRRPALRAGGGTLGLFTALTHRRARAPRAARSGRHRPGRRRGRWTRGTLTRLEHASCTLSIDAARAPRTSRTCCCATRSGPSTSRSAARPPRSRVKSDGNPFFVVRDHPGATRGAIHHGRAPTGRGPRRGSIDHIQIPSSVLDLVNARVVATLDADERDLLDVAACSGFEFRSGADRRGLPG